MSYNGSGTFLINTAGQPVVANTVISATVFNALTADLATGLSTAITKDGQTTITANIPFASNKITGLGAGTLASDAAQLGQVQSTAAKLITVSGTDTITGTMSPTLTAYAAGQLFYFVAAGANTTTVTLNVDGLGAKAVTRDGSTALAAGDINSGEVVVVIYDGTRFQMINAANSFGNTTINGTLTVTGNTGLQANVSITSALSVGGVFAVTGNAGFQANVSITSALSVGGVFAVTGASTLTSASISTGNLTFSSTGQRITGDLANATDSSRLLFQNSTTNGNSNIGIIPNGTATTAAFRAYGVSDADNSIVGQLSAIGTTEVRLASNKNGTASYAPMTFYTGGSERLRLDTSGNLGIGTSSPTAKLDVSGSINLGASYINLASTNGVIGDWVSGYNINWNSGVKNVALGAANGFYQSNSGYIALHTNSSAAAGTTVPERMRIDSSGNVGIGGTANADVRCHVLGTAPSSSAQSRGFLASQTIPSGTTSNFIGYGSVPSTQAASFTLSSLYHFWASQSTLGASSAVTNQYGFFAENTLTGATNNYGFYSNIASGSNRWNFYAAGTAQNYFAGDVLVNATTSNGAKVVAYQGGAQSPSTSGNMTTGFMFGEGSGSPTLNFGTDTDGIWYNAAYANNAGVTRLHRWLTGGTERMRITGAGNIVAGGSVALATTATDGFLYVPTCAGTPTGTPTAITGMAPIVVNTTNNKLYFYSGGAWRDAGP